MAGVGLATIAVAGGIDVAIRLRFGAGRLVAGRFGLVR